MDSAVSPSALRKLDGSFDGGAAAEEGPLLRRQRQLVQVHRLHPHHLRRQLPLAHGQVLLERQGQAIRRALRSGMYLEDAVNMLYLPHLNLQRFLLVKIIFLYYTRHYP